MRPKILIVTDSCYLSTGFSTVARNIYKLINDVYEVRFFSTIYHNQPKSLPVNYIPKDNHELAFAKIIQMYNPDLVLSITDIWRLEFLYNVKQKHRFSWLAYVPVEGKHFPKTIYNNGKIHNLKQYLDYAERKIAYSKFGMQELNQVTNVHGYIYHGVDRNTFIPTILPDNVKEAFFKDKDNPLVFLSIGDNMLRKRYDILLKAWKKFYTKNTNAVLLLLTHPRSPINGWDLPELINRYNVNDSVYYDESYVKGVGYSESELVKIYNLADVYISLSAAEGFGLPLLESMSCGTPVIYTDYATPAEYIGDAGYKIKVRDTYPCITSNTLWAEADITAASRAMRNLYEKSYERSMYSRRGLEVSEKLNWQCLQHDWLREIAAALGSAPHVGYVV